MLDCVSHFSILPNELLWDCSLFHMFGSCSIILFFIKKILTLNVVNSSFRSYGGHGILFKPQHLLTIESHSHVILKILVCEVCTTQKWSRFCLKITPCQCHKIVPFPCYGLVSGPLKQLYIFFACIGTISKNTSIRHLLFLSCCIPV